MIKKAAAAFCMKEGRKSCTPDDNDWLEERVSTYGMTYQRYVVPPFPGLKTTRPTMTTTTPAANTNTHNEDTKTRKTNNITTQEKITPNQQAPTTSRTSMV